MSRFIFGERVDQRRCAEEAGERDEEAVVPAGASGRRRRLLGMRGGSYMALLAPSVELKNEGFCTARAQEAGKVALRSRRRRSEHLILVSWATVAKMPVPVLWASGL